MFAIIGDMGMTGQLIRLNCYQWQAVTEAKLEKFPYIAILRGRQLVQGRRGRSADDEEETGRKTPMNQLSYPLA